MLTNQTAFRGKEPRNVTASELGRLFKRWMLKNHPDKGGDQALAGAHG